MLIVVTKRILEVDNTIVHVLDFYLDQQQQGPEQEHGQKVSMKCCADGDRKMMVILRTMFFLCERYYWVLLLLLLLLLLYRDNTGE
jgi:hypothetical protein